MFEFFTANDANADATTAASLFEGHTVVLPAVSYANLGQLTLDLVINTLLVHGTALHAEITKVGYFVSENVPPLAGSAAFATQQHESLCLNLEVYQIASHKITIVQQRAAAFTGRAHAFAAEFVEWATRSRITSLCVVAGIDDMLRHDTNMQIRPIRTIVAGDASTLVTPTFVDQFAALSTADVSTNNEWTNVRGAGLAPLLHAQCVASKLPSVALLMACAEGDNVPDAVAMATHLLTYLQLLPLDKKSQFVFPPSWSQLFGRGPDAALYL